MGYAVYSSVAVHLFVFFVGGGEGWWKVCWSNSDKDSCLRHVRLGMIAAVTVGPRPLDSGPPVGRLTVVLCSFVYLFVCLFCCRDFSTRREKVALCSGDCSAKDFR